MNMNMNMNEQDQTQESIKHRKLSDEALGLILLFAAIPLIAYIKWVYDDHVLLGALGSAVLAAAAIVLRKRFS